MMKVACRTSIQLACVLAFAAASGSAVAAASYDCQMLETTGGYTYAWTAAINAAGEVAGYADFPAGHDAARWSADGFVTELGNLGHEGVARAINDNGLVIGESWTADYDRLLPVRWSGTTPTPLPLRPGDLAGAAYGVNNRGVIVGISRTTNFGRGHAVMWRNGKVIDLGTLGDQASQASRSSRATAINNDGAIVGRSDVDGAGSSHAVWWDTSRQIHDLGTLPGGLNSTASAINSHGVVVGSSERAAGDTAVHAVAWVNGEPRDLGVLPGHTQSEAYGINRAGTVVGSGAVDDSFQHRVALVWPGLNRAPKDLNKLLTPACQLAMGSFRLIRASDINRNGAIAATGEYFDGMGGLHYGAFKLVPVTVSTAAD
jgi:probable HAF family extracellular repeat protein